MDTNNDHTIPCSCMRMRANKLTHRGNSFENSRLRLVCMYVCMYIQNVAYQQGVHGAKCVPSVRHYIGGISHSTRKMAPITGRVCPFLVFLEFSKTK